MSDEGNQTQTFSIFGLYYTGDGTRDGSTGGAMSDQKLPNGELNNIFDGVTDALALTGGKKYKVLVLKNESEDKISLKTSFIQEVLSNNPDISFKIAISSTGINQAPVVLADEDTEPVTENFIEVPGKPTLPNIGDLRPGDYIGIHIEMTVKQGTDSAQAVTALFSAVGNSEPIPVEEEPDPGEQPCEAEHHRDFETGECVPNDCDPGFKWDPTANGGRGGCVEEDVPVNCPSGQHYDEELQQCVDDEVPPSTFVQFAHIFVGDFDCNSRTDRTFQMIQDVVDQVNKVAPGTFTFFYPLGDYSYGSSQSCWLNRVDALKGLPRDQIFPAIGNHDDRESGSTSKRNAIINGFPATANSSGIYSATLQPVRYIVMDTQTDYDENSGQYFFVKSQLEDAAADGSIKWIIVIYHKPSIVSDKPDHGALTDFRDIYHPLFEQYKVNVVFSGHNHVYHRSYPLKYNASSPRNPIVATTRTGDPDTPGQLYNGDEGTVFVTVGTGGRKLDSFSGSQENYIKTREEEFGIMVGSCFNNGNTLAFFFRATNGDILDQFNLVKGAVNGNPP